MGIAILEKRAIVSSTLKSEGSVPGPYPYQSASLQTPQYLGGVPTWPQEYDARESLQTTAAQQPLGSLTQPADEFDFSFVRTPAQIAVYDDFLSEPRVFTVAPAPTTDFIGSLAAAVYRQSQQAGGNIAYSIILQVTENFIHARFSEMVVSIYNQGKTIRFSDQGPGFKNKELALQPGFSSATQPMKQYIKGVGSGLPTVKEWLQVANAGGRITIEDNLNGGAVVTLTVSEEPKQVPPTQQTVAPMPLPSLNDKEKVYLIHLYQEGPLRNTDLSELTNIPKATVSYGLQKLQEANLITFEQGTKRRMLTPYGEQVAARLVKNQ